MPTTRSKKRRSHLSQTSEFEPSRDSIRVSAMAMTDASNSDIAVLKTYGAAPYANALKKLEKDIKDKQNSVNEKIGVKVITCSALPTP